MYYALWTTLLELLKERYKGAAHIDEADFDKGRSSDKHRKVCSLKEHRINLMCEGCTEAEDEIAYIASRKALNFNLFGPDSVFFWKNRIGISKGSYHTFFNQKVRLLNRKNSVVTLDTILEGKEEIEIIRTQFLEWIVLKRRLIKDSFLDERCYFDQTAGKVFAPTIQKMLSMYTTDGGEYPSIFSSIDALFVIKEILAAYNLLLEDPRFQKETLKRINIIECYWRPLNYGVLDQYAGRVHMKESKMVEEAEEMMSLIKPVTDLFQEKFGVSLNIKCINMWHMLTAQKYAKFKLFWMERFMI